MKCFCKVNTWWCNGLLLRFYASPKQNVRASKPIARETESLIRFGGQLVIFFLRSKDSAKHVSPNAYAILIMEFVLLVHVLVIVSLFVLAQVVLFD